MFATLAEQLQQLDNDGVTERLRELEVERRRIEAETSALISLAQARQVPRDDGHHGVAGWLRANLNWSGAQVAAAKQASLLLDAHEVVGDALLAGHLGTAQVGELARAARNPRCGAEIGDILDILLEHGEQLPFDDFRRVVRRWESLADEDGAELDDEANANSRTASLHERDGAVDLIARGGSAMTTAEMLGVFELFVEAEFRNDVATRTELHGPDAPASLLPRNDAQRRFDALHEIFRRAVSTPVGSQAPEPIVNLLVDQYTHEVLLARHRLVPFPDDIGAPDLSHMRCETDSGIPVPPEAVFQATMQGYVRRLVVDDDGVVLNMGRKRRLFSGGARTAVKLMECHCGHPGCTVSARHADIDHIDEWDRDHGHTDVDNGRPRCNAHNRAKTRLGLVDKRTRGGRIVTYRCDGTAMLPVGCRAPDDDDPDDADGSDDAGLARLVRELRPLQDDR